MKVILIKKHKPHSRQLPIGQIMDVTNGYGEELIRKGIAKPYQEKTEPVKNEAIKNVILQDNEEKKETPKKNK